jgi:hypothetical protein
MSDNYELEPWRAPTLKEGDELVYCEHGRIVYRTPEKKPGSGTDCRSHWFRIVRNGGSYALLVKHGGGEQRVELGYNYRQQDAIFGPLSSDARFWLMWIILEVHNNAGQAATQKTASVYKSAFVSGTLKKRKVRGQQAVKVWIERATVDEMRASLCIDRG